MKKYIIFIAIIIVGLLTLTACTNMEKTPIENTTQDQNVERVEEPTESTINVEENVNEKVEEKVEETLPAETPNSNVVETPSTTNKSEDTLEIINSASRVTIREEFISLNKKYNIFVDGKQVATISGKYINLTGDVFTLTDMSSNVLAKEKQIKRWGVKLNRLAHIMDKNGNTDGYVGEEFFTDFFSISKYKFHFYDKNKNEIGHTREQVLSLLYQFNVFNNANEKVYDVDKNFTLFVDEYTIEKVKDSDVQMKDVVFLTCITDAIMDAAKKDK